MGHGAMLPPVSIAERPPAAPADTALRITVIIAILPVRGASTATPSTAEARLVPAAVRQPMPMPITAILMDRGQERTIRSTIALIRALHVEIPASNMQTTSTQTATESATTAALRSVCRSNGTQAQTAAPLPTRPASPRQASRMRRQPPRRARRSRPVMRSRAGTRLLLAAV